MTSRNSLWKRSYMSVTGHLDRRYGWSRLPKPIALLTLMGLRMRLRREQPLRHLGRHPALGTEPAARRATTADPSGRRHGQRPDPRSDGIGRCPLRSQRPAGGDGSVEGAHAEPAPGEPGAAHPREVPTGHDAQRAGRGVAPVRGARLVQPRDQRARRPLAGRPRPERPVAAAPDADTADAPGCPHDGREAPHLRQHRDALVGRFAGVRQHARAPEDDPDQRGRQGPAEPPGPRALRPVHHASDGRRQRELVARPGHLHHGLHARAQRHLRAPRPRPPGLGRRRAVRARPARERRPHRQDPHRRVDDRPVGRLDHADRYARQLVGLHGRALLTPLRPDQQERGGQRYPRVADLAARRAVRHDRGVRRRLPDASAHPRRLLHPLGERQPRHRELHLPGDLGDADARGPRHGGHERPHLLVRDVEPRGDRPQQLPEGPAALRQAGRQHPRPGRHRPPAQPGAGRAPVQRVPPQVPPGSRRAVRGLQRRPGRGREAAEHLRRPRGRRPDDRPVHRGTAEGLRVQRHRLPRLHPDGVPAPEERPLLHLRLPAGGLQRTRAWRGSPTTTWARCWRGTSRSWPPT